MSRRLPAASVRIAPLLAALCLALLLPGGALAAGEPAATEPAATEPTTSPPAVEPTPTEPVAGSTTTTEPAGSPGTGATGPMDAGGAVGPAQRPQLLLFHGGSFLYGDPYFEPLTRPRALAAGFVPHYVNYPLGNLPAAVERARGEARRLREKFGLDRVYAYGSSAGGTLAALLSGDELVSAAVAKAPVSDLTTWEWPLAKYGPEYWESLGVDLAARERLSPIRRLQLAPLLIVQGRADGTVPAAMNETFAAAYPRVSLWLVAGGHTTDRVRPFLITRAMDWLARIASRKAATTH